MAKAAITTAARILKARKTKKMSLREVSQKAKVAYGTLWNWEAGRCVPAPGDPALKRVADVLGLPKTAVTNPA